MSFGHCQGYCEACGETSGLRHLYGQEKSDSEFRVVINKAKAMEHQLTVAQVYQEDGRSALAEASSATTLSTAIKDYDVFVRDEKEEQLTREDLKNLTLEVTGAGRNKADRTPGRHCGF